MGRSETQIHFSALERPYDFLSPFSGEEFAAMIWVADPTVTDEEQARLSEQLVEQGCRYAVCGGHECSTWDDSIDMAFLETDPDFQPPDEKFVMTTWHEGESVEEVAEFLALNTSFDNFVAKNFFVLFVGRNKELEERSAQAMKSLLGTRAGGDARLDR